MKERIDILLVKKGLVDSRYKAQWLIKNGYVFVNKKQVKKPSKRIDNSLEIQLIKQFPYVGRGGFKLEAALKDFSIQVKGKICADIGASVGGFTDCLIQHGASKVYAIDIAADLLHPSLRNEKMSNMVVPIFGVDARDLIPIEEEFDICTIDVTFASLRTILPNLRGYIKKNGDIIVLVKPIFETEFHSIIKFDTIIEPKKLFQILIDLMQWNIDNQFFPHGIIKSPILGKGGSREFFIHLKLKDFNLNLNFEELITDIL